MTDTTTIDDMRHAFRVWLKHEFNPGTFDSFPPGLGAVQVGETIERPRPLIPRTLSGPFTCAYCDSDRSYYLWGIEYCSECSRVQQ